jgi:hypothetical protein
VRSRLFDSTLYIRAIICILIIQYCRASWRARCRTFIKVSKFGCSSVETSQSAVVYPKSGQAIAFHEKYNPDEAKKLYQRLREMKLV